MNLRLAKGYGPTAPEAALFHRFVGEVFGGEVSFEDWARRGYWSDRYVPYSFIDGNRMVANASAVRMQLIAGPDGAPRYTSGIQFATVGTAPEYRDRGLARRLIQAALDDHRDAAYVFLYGNDDVLDFYPKLGFSPVQEHLFEGAPQTCAQLNLRRLTFTGDTPIIERMARERQPITHRFGAADYDHILLFHIMHFFPGALHHFPDDDILIITTAEAGTLHVHDILFTREIAAEDLRACVYVIAAEHKVRRIVYHFTPERVDPAARPFETRFDSPLFVRGALPASPPFKFPALAQT